jgi:hypothetical protein
MGKQGSRRAIVNTMRELAKRFQHDAGQCEVKAGKIPAETHPGEVAAMKAKAAVYNEVAIRLLAALGTEQE